MFAWYIKLVFLNMSLQNAVEIRRKQDYFILHNMGSQEDYSSQGSDYCTEQYDFIKRNMHSKDIILSSRTQY